MLNRKKKRGKKKKKKKKKEEEKIKSGVITKVCEGARGGGGDASGTRESSSL